MIPNLVITEDQAEVLIRMFRTPAGREASEVFRNIADLMSFDTDPSVTSFNEGRRQLALFLAMAGKKSIGVVGADHIDELDFDDSDIERI